MKLNLSCVLSIAMYSILTASSLSAQIEMTEKIGVPLGGTGVGYTSPAIAEIDGNASNGLEIAVAGSDGTLEVVGATGTILWSKQLPNYLCSDTSKTDKVFSSPAVGALYGNGIPYVVIGYGGFGGGTFCDGGVAAFRGSDGKQMWAFSLMKFKKQKKFFAASHTVFSTPALADVDGDGKLEVGFGSFDRNIYFLEYNGKLRAFYHAADTVWSSPSFVNINADSALEMLIGTDISRNDKIVPPTIDGGYMLALGTNKPKNQELPFRDQNTVRWSTSFNQVVFSSPVVGDVLKTKKSDELVVGSGCYFPEGSSLKRGNEFRVLDIASGRVLKKFKTPICSPSSAAIGDVNKDGVTDVVITVSGERQWGGDGKGRVYAWTPSTGVTLWQTTLNAMFPFQSPLIADLDLDGTNDVIVATAGTVNVLNGTTGAVELVLGNPGTSQGTPAIADVDSNGKLDLVVAGGRANQGSLSIFKDFYSPTTKNTLDSNSAVVVPWPQWRGSANKNGKR